MKNNGASDADNVHLTDTVDARLVVDSITAGDYTCGAPSQSISCTLGHLAAGATKPITVTYHVASTTNAAAGVSNSASASSDEVGPATGSATVDIVTSADLSIAKSGPTSAIAGAAAGFDYTITVHNNGPSSNIGGFHVTDTLPAGLTFQAAGSSSSCLAVGQVVTCTNSIGLASGANAMFTADARVAASSA